jgi:serine phosphatase RsbU (regulator of sigma subunit)
MPFSPTPTLLPWTLSALLVAPWALLWAAAALVGLEGRAGIGLLAAGGLYLVAVLAGVQPWLVRARSRRRLGLARHATWFRERAAQCADVAALAALLAEAGQRLLGSKRALLIVGDPSRGLQVHGGSEHDAALVRGSSAAVIELAHQPDVCSTATGIPGAAAGALLAALGYDLALPLRHGNTALGLALLDADPRRLRRVGAHAPAWLRSALSTAVARHSLGFDLQHRVALKSSLDYARAAQEAIMPAETPFRSDGFVIHGLFRPAAQCGGDLWLWRRLGPGRILVVLGDVTGHGVAPAMLSAAAAGVVQIQAIAAGASVDPGEVLAAINHSIHRLTRGSFLMTAFAAVLDREQGTLRYANAAQTFPHLQRLAPSGAAGAQLQPLVAPGAMLGGDDAARFPIHTQAIAPGTRLILYTDGIVDAARRDGKTYGDRRLRKMLMTLAEAPAEAVAPAVLGDVQAFLGGAQAGDDMTVVVVDWPRNTEVA